MAVNDNAMFKILEKKMLNPTICKMVVEAPRIAKAALPGLRKHLLHLYYPFLTIYGYLQESIDSSCNYS